MSQPAPDWVAYHATRSPHSLALESVDTGATLTWAALEQQVATSGRLPRQRRDLAR